MNIIWELYVITVATVAMGTKVDCESSRMLTVQQEGIKEHMVCGRCELT